MFSVSYGANVQGEIIMKNQFWNYGYRSRCLRLICIICTMVFVMIACIGCNTKASSDEVAELKKELTDAKAEIDSLKASYGASQKEIASLKVYNQAAQKDLDQIKSDYEEVQRQVDSLKNKNDAAKEEIDSLKDINEAAQQEIEELKEQIRELQDKLMTDKIRIYIDQGHNPTYYHNSGATGNGLYEQDLTFTVGCLLAELLENDGRFEICLSRPTEDTVLGSDNTSSLEARVRGAEEFGADYFISLHTNSYESDSASGIEVYVAEQDAIAYSFGNSLLQGMLKSTNLQSRGMKLNSDLHVLKNTTMPAALLEMGYISNSGDAALLGQNPELFAQGIYDGILTYFNFS